MSPQGHTGVSSSDLPRVSPLRLAFRNLTGHAFRSLGVFLSAVLVSGFALGTSLVLRGAEDSLRLAIERLGADIIVVPEGNTNTVESAMLMGKPAEGWMPQERVGQVAAIPGVAAASPQRYLATLPGGDCCGVDELALAAFDPGTDFTLRPWLEGNIPAGLGPGEVVAGAGVAYGKTEIEIGGMPLKIRYRLEPAGSALDRSLFVGFETAEALAGHLPQELIGAAKLPPGSSSAILVQLEPGADPLEVSLEIMRQVPGVTPVQNLQLFASYRRQWRGLMAGLLVLAGLSLGLSLALAVLVFTLAANERRRELGVLRALGANRGFVLRSLLLEAVFLALAGGVVGAGAAVLVLSLLRSALVRSLGLPFTLPEPGALLIQVAVGAGVALVGICLAALVPALRISRMEPAVAMRE